MSVTPNCSNNESTSISNKLTLIFVNQFLLKFTEIVLFIFYFVLIYVDRFASTSSVHRLTQSQSFDTFQNEYLQLDVGSSAAIAIDGQATRDIFVEERTEAE